MRPELIVVSNLGPIERGRRFRVERAAEVKQIALNCNGGDRIKAAAWIDRQKPKNKSQAVDYHTAAVELRALTFEDL